MPDMLKRERFRIAGQVQGVGFRPHVYRLARDIGLAGWVINDGSGAVLEAQGTPAQIDELARRLVGELPPLAMVRQCRRQDVPLVPEERTFEIRRSEAGELGDAQVTVDTATCPDCLRELLTPGDPRHRYPFINCTNCGPRYSIITRIPYDRPYTTMSDFAMCRLCAGQYADPADRRFHAQPIACPACGPSCWLIDSHGKQLVCDDPFAEAAEALFQGRIVALKGLGGFHLACRADDEHAVRRLRMRKHRDAKPFAVMVADVAQARRFCHVDEAAEKLLAGPLRPIVLLPRRPGAGIADSVAPGLDTLGLMLPYTPVHHLLLEHRLSPLVMTSGNVGDEPLVKDNEDAVSHLGRIADFILLHNRRIQRSIDDSVAQSRGPGRITLLRRARGYAPQPVMLGLGPSPVVLAVGGELKSAVCLYKDGRAVLSEHVGDLKDGRVYRHFMQVISDLEQLFDLQPQVLAADLHPQYLSTEYAVLRAAGQLAGRPPLPLVRVQHHHAHIAACMAENGVTEEVIGLACDGTGYGPDGAIWGCEVLRADLAGYTRLGHLRYFASPGGDAAAIRTYRPAAALLLDALEIAGPEAARRHLLLEPEKMDVLLEQLRTGANCTPTSSLGRLFDAVAGLCGLCWENRYEGEAPMLLEAAAASAGKVGDEYPFAIAPSGGLFQMDVRPMMRAIVDDLRRHVEPPEIAARFHNTVASLLAAAADEARRQTNLAAVALSGGCFANRYMTSRLEMLLAERGFKVLTHQAIPCNDACVALGQAVIAAAQQQASTQGPRRTRRETDQ